jgi:LPXTG-motif cell wall-anchored protein
MAQCYKLASAPFGGCTFVYKNEFGATITLNVPPEDVGLCFLACVTEVISDDCGFLDQGVGCTDPLCDCNPPPPSSTPNETPSNTPTPDVTPSPEASTIAGGELPNTETPWISFAIIGSLLALLGGVLIVTRRKRK